MSDRQYREFLPEHYERTQARIGKKAPLREHLVESGAPPEIVEHACEQMKRAGGDPERRVTYGGCDVWGLRNGGGDGADPS